MQDRQNLFKKYLGEEKRENKITCINICQLSIIFFIITHQLFFNSPIQSCPANVFPRSHLHTFLAAQFNLR